jgi:hypothetical protein
VAAAKRVPKILTIVKQGVGYLPSFPFARPNILNRTRMDRGNLWVSGLNGSPQGCRKILLDALCEPFVFATARVAPFKLWIVRKVTRIYASTDISIQH